MRFTARVLSSSFLFLLAMMMLPSAARATEHGGTVWPVGAESFATAEAVPAAHKAMFQEYTCFYFANEMDDAKGKNAGIPDFKLRAFAVAGKVAYNWGVKVPGGQLGSYVALPFVYEQLHVPTGKYTRFDLSNVNIVPINVHDHKGPVYWYYELQYESKAVGYDSTKELNIGEHYDAFTPSVAITLTPHKGKQNIMSRFDYEFNSHDSATHYHSGNEFFWQFGAQQEVAHRTTLGLTGYFYKQITSDTQNGLPVVTTNSDGSTSIGYKGRVFALGPQATFPLGKHGAIVVKWDHDFLVQNKPRGNGLWFQFGVPLKFSRSK